MPSASPLANLALSRNAAMLDFEDGRLPEAEARLSEVLDTLEKLYGQGVAAEQAAALRDRATVRRYARRPREALADLARAEALCGSMPPFQARMTRLRVWQDQIGLWGDAESGAYDPERAANLLERLRAQGLGSWWVEEAEATLAFQARDWERAAKLSESVAHQLARDGWKRGEVAALARAAHAWLELGETERAAPGLQTALTFLGQHGPPDLLARAQLNWARVLRGRGLHEESWHSAAEALSGFEHLIRHHRALGDQQRFMAGKMQVYAQAFALALEMPGASVISRAWEVAERAKSFYLCQMVANADVRLFEGVDPALTERLVRLEQEQDDLEVRLRLGNASTETQLGALSRERSDLLDAIMRANPRWAAARHPAPFDLDAALKQLPTGWSALSYFWQDGVSGEESGARLHLFHARAGELSHLVTDWSGEERTTLEESCAALRTTNPIFLKRLLPDNLVRKLLPDTLIRLLKHDGPLLVSPHGPLRAVPLAALPLPNGEPLIAHFPLQMLPTLALLTLAGESQESRSVLLLGCAQDGFGSTELPGVNQELAELDALWRERGLDTHHVLLSANDKLESAGAPPSTWTKHRLIHLACHGKFNAEHPLDAALYLGGEALRVSELFSMRLAASMVCLSACDLGAHGGHIDADAQAAGDEWLGMVLPLLSAGARTVLASLWAADSAFACDFMRILHQQLAQGETPVKAYRAALLAKRGARLGFWANWQLVGFPTPIPC